MTDIQLLLCVLMSAAVVAAAGFLRGASQRVHYSERRAFWRNVAPVLILSGLGIAMAALVLQGWVADGFLWAAAALALLGGAASYWVDLDPQRVLAWRRVSR